VVTKGEGGGGRPLKEQSVEKRGGGNSIEGKEKTALGKFGKKGKSRWYKRQKGGTLSIASKREGGGEAHSSGGGGGGEILRGKAWRGGISIKQKKGKKETIDGGKKGGKKKCAPAGVKP